MLKIIWSLLVFSNILFNRIKLFIKAYKKTTLSTLIDDTSLTNIFCDKQSKKTALFFR